MRGLLLAAIVLLPVACAPATLAAADGDDDGPPMGIDVPLLEPHRDPSKPTSPGAAPRTTWSGAPAPPAGTPTPESAPRGFTDRLASAAVAAAGALAALGVAAYHRLRGERTLEAAARARLAAFLHERPGASQAEAARALGVDATTARYHLLRLEKEGLAVRVEGGWFVAGSVAREERARFLAAEGSEAVLAAVRATPGSSLTELAERLALARSTVSWHVRKLASAGWVRVERAGRETRVRPA
jgi:DNA-binding MarR family transcriptional regulator